MFNKYLIWFVIIFIVFSCKKEEENNVGIINENFTEKKELEYKKLFLNLSPRMTSKVFNNKLKENSSINEKGNIEIILNNEVVEFSIIKGKNHIEIKNKTIFKENMSYLYSSTCIKHLSESKNILDDFKRIFESKYKRNKTAEQLFKKYSIWFDDLIYKDSLKTIVLKSKIFGRVYECDREISERIDYNKITNIPPPKYDYDNLGSSLRSDYDYYLSFLKDPRYDKASVELAIRNSSKSIFDNEDRYINFGYELSAKYYFNQEFDTIIKNYKSNGEKIERKKRKQRITQDSLKRERTQKLKINEKMF